MAIYDGPIAGVVISSLANNAKELIDRVPQESESGWDTMRDSWLVRMDSAGIDPQLVVDAHFARGAQISGKNMWIVGSTGRCRGPGIFVIEVTSMGLLSTRGYKVRYGAASEMQQKDNVIVSGVNRPHLATRESAVTAELEYILFGSASSLTAVVGTTGGSLGSWAPTVRSSIWAGIDDPTYHYPNGWVFDAADMENLPGLTTVWLAKEHYAYQYPYSP